MSESTPEVDSGQLEEPEELGSGLEPGARHYRAFVGPPEDYDLIAAMTFGLLTTLGLRQHHRLLDIGCGSLRVGRLLIPYLNRGGYTGFEPNGWLVEEGIARECGRDQIAIKQPRFVLEQDPRALEGCGPFDFALAQSIFSHAGLDLISTWLAALEGCLASDGVLVATFIESDVDHPEPGWIYPGCVSYRRTTVEGLAREHGFAFRVLDWRHPRQTWALFAKPDFETRWREDRPLSWNARHDSRG